MKVVILNFIKEFTLSVDREITNNKIIALLTPDLKNNW